MTTIRNVTCDNCSASYPIDFSKLKRERNRITCKRCQHKVVFYKSSALEPQNEAAQIDHADEKTLVEDDRKVPNVQKPIQNDPQTAVSNHQPPVLRDIASATKELSDPTIRRQAPLPTEEKPKINIRKPSPQNNKNVDKELAEKAPKSSALKKKSGSDPLGLRGALQLCTGMMILGLVSIAGMHFAPDSIGDMAFLVGSSSLTLGALWLVTSDFGFSKPSMGFSVGGASIVAIATGALVFSGSDSVDQSQEQIEVEEPADILPTVEVADKPDQPLEEKEASFERSKSKESSNKNTRSMGATSATVLDAEKSNKAHKDMFAAANQYISSKDTPKPEVNEEDDDDMDIVARPSDIAPPVEPDELLEDDLDLEGFDDLGLDDDDTEKKGLFGRKDKEESKPEPKPEPKAKSSSKKVNVEQHILDIIIRNNKDVKGCYAQVRAETGTFPKVTDVMFTLQPTGKVSSAYIASGPYVGSKFEGCLRAAFKGMTFPTSDADATPQTLKYTFRL